MTALAYDVRTVCEDDPSLFHAPDQESPAAKRWRETEAKHYCLNLCPAAVRESCLQIAMEAEHGLSAGNRNGIFGGLNEKERADLDRDDSYDCRQCGRHFTSRSSLTQHTTMAHAEDSQRRTDTIRSMAAAGHSDVEIGAAIGMSVDGVGRARKRYGIKAGVSRRGGKKANR